MRSLLDLQCELLKEDSDGVRQFLDEIDRRTANESMVAAGESLGFQVGSLDGWAVTTGAEIGRVMGYKSDSTVRKHRSSYGTMGFTAGTSLPEFTKLREAFGLHPNDGRTVFYTWDTILVCGMRGETPEARRLQLYLLDSERTLRILTDAEFQRARKTQWDELRVLGQMVDRIRKSPDDDLRALLIAKTEEALGHSISGHRSPQLSLIQGGGGPAAGEPPAKK